MKALLDTHTLIWNLEADPNLPDHLQEIIDDTSNEIFVSIASLWEMTVKTSLGKLSLSKSLDEIFQHILSVDFQILPISLRQLLTLENLPFHHRDPFDRVIIAQCQTESLILLSKDGVFGKYDVELLWNKNG